VLKYIRSDGSIWHSSVIDEIAWGPVVYGSASLTFSGDGNPAIAYRTNGYDLKYATIPEPSSILAMLCGLGAVGGMLRRRR
jgi:hypothetical protein